MTFRTSFLRSKASLPHEILVAGMNEFERKLAQRQVESILAAFQEWQRGTSDSGGYRDSFRLAYGYETDRQGRDTMPLPLATTIDLQGCLIQLIQRQVERQAILRQAYTDFSRMHGRAGTSLERHRLIIDFARQLGATRSQLREDDRAFDRWFESDAIVERFHRRLAESEQLTEFALNRLGPLSMRLISEVVNPEARMTVWRQLRWDEIAARFLLESRSDFRVMTALLRSLRQAIRSMPGQRETLLNEFTIRDVTKLALDPKRNVWVQAEALALLAIAKPFAFPELANDRLKHHGKQDDLFVRRRIVRLLTTLPRFVNGHDQRTRTNLSHDALGSVTSTSPAGAAHIRKTGSIGEDHSGVIEALLVTASHDESPSVRQSAAEGLAAFPLTEQTRSRLYYLISLDPEPSVRAATVVEVAKRAERNDLRIWFVQRSIDMMSNESNPFVLRTVLHATTQWFARLNPCDEEIKLMGQQLLLPMRQLQSSAVSLAVRRWAACAAERIWLAVTPEARTIRSLLPERVTMLDPHRSAWFPEQLLRNHDQSIVGRVLSVLAQDDYGFDIEDTWPSPVVRRGPTFAFRLWRLMHELRNPSPDKRQAFRHTVGRESHSHFRVPAELLSELSPTKVPGEPLFMANEQSWRPYLPLVDDVISSLGQWLIIRTVTFYTAHGITRLTPPRFWPMRLRAWLKLTASFTHFAALRNWNEEADSAPNAYVEELRRLGFVIEFQPYFGADGLPVAVDLSVTRFFARGSGVPSVIANPQDSGAVRTEVTSNHAGNSASHAPQHTDRSPDNPGSSGTIASSGLLPILGATPWTDAASRWLGDFASYFGSVYENSVGQLVMFVGVVFAAFFFRQLWQTQQIRRSRRSLSLTIGGWGTRGKSGTERLKGALFNALGYALVSKSTGCEAMFLHGSTYGSLRELILYRPYDKATIWEHADVLNMAHRLNVPVFLWECMGLTPAYVNVLQQQWSRDDISTITNAFPDHEDIQGPAGLNVAEAISSFIPRSSTLITTERQMRPILDHQARRLHTEVVSAGWLETGLLPPDLLQRFPYNEHPDNIALVLQLARVLNIDPDFALKEMADRLVPDLGVLKTYPTGTIRSRRIEFSNGMSANERHGCLNNWSRLGFDRHDPFVEPGTWITTVVNNRADRIARSQVFASILVNDLQADRHFLIGGNLKGLVGYIREAWEQWASTITLQPRDDNNPNAYAVYMVKKMAKRLRVAVDEKQILQTLSVMLEGAARSTKHLNSASLIRKILPHWSNPDIVAGELARSGVNESIVADIQRQHQQRLRGLTEYQQFVEKLMASSPEAIQQQPRTMNSEFRALMWSWFERKLVIVENYHATGEQIIDLIASETPPGFLNRVMGIQNIKGTGLDFVYRWLAWMTCAEACDQLQLAEDVETFRRGLRTLSDYREFGVLSRERVPQALADARHSTFAQDEHSQSLLDQIEATYKAGMLELDSNIQQTASVSGQLDRVLHWIEEFLDASDSVKRRKLANQIYTDLAHERIGTDRAMLELRKLSQRQKGGWLLRREH